MARLELKFLGGLDVIRDGQSLALPPSKKTRALLAYLALNRRAFRREHLCELLWEVPDDPRGSLRWSLSKLRRLVDDPHRARIVADRATVRFDATDARIDIVALQELTDEELERRSTDELEGLVARWSGTPLEGLDLPDFHEYQAWCVAERELATRAQVHLCKALIRRLAEDPGRALPHAHALVGLCPHEEAPRAAVIRLLVALGRTAEAQQQYALGTRALKDAGVAPTGDMMRALRNPAALVGTASSADLTPEPGRATADSDHASSPQLVGREAEVARFEAALRVACEERRCALVLVCGEPGIGKSRLLECAAALARDADALLLEATAFESETVRPFALWVDALRRLGDRAEEAVLDVSAHGDRHRLFSGLGDLINVRARGRPVALVFDDLQWGDESSAAALHFIVRSSADRPLFGVLAGREDELRRNGPMLRAVRELRQAGLLEELKLGPLPEAAAAALIRARAPGVDSERLARECHGNPLLAIELARAEASGDSGQSLGELVQERLGRFDMEGGEVLRWAAVLAPRIDAGVLARATGKDWNSIGETLETAARQSMLVPTERGFKFSHELISTSIYAALSPARRRSMHRRIAEILEQDTVLDPQRAADLAHHAAQSGDPALAARSMVSAGRLCLRFFANEEALALARRGLEWVEQLPGAERVCLTLELREVMLSAAPLEDWERAAAEYASLAEQALDYGALSHARRGYYMASTVRWMHGQWAGAREEILESERVTRGAGDEEHVAGMAEAARCLAMLERDLAQADAMLMEAQALAMRSSIRHYALPAALGMLRFHENRLDEAEGLFKEARTLARSAGDRFSEFQANEYLAMLEIERGRPSAAQMHCATLLELASKLREGSEQPFAEALAALCRYQLVDDAAPLDEAIARLRDCDAKHRLAYTLTRAAFIDLDRGRAATSLERARESLECAQVLDRPSEIVMAHVALALGFRATGDASGAARHAAALAAFDSVPIAAWARARAVGITNLAA